MSELAFPEIVEPPIAAPVIPSPPPSVSAKTEVAVAATANALDYSKVDLTDVALAQFGKWREHVADVEKNLSTLVLDLSTQARIDEAKSLRHRLIGQPRAEVRKVCKELKSKLTKVSKAIGTEEETAVAAYDAVELLISPQIEERQAKLDADKEAARLAEEARKAKHEAGIATIRSYVAKADGLPSDRIAAGIPLLEAMTFGAEWEEFAVPAANAQCETIVALRTLLTTTLAREAEELRVAAERVELERLRAEKAAQEAAAVQISIIRSTVIECVGESAAFISTRVDLLASTVYSEGVRPEVLTAHEDALANLKKMLEAAQRQEAVAAELEALRAAQAQAQVEPTVAPPTLTSNAQEEGSLPAATGTNASTEPEAAQGSGSGDEGTAAHAEERVAPPTSRGTHSFSAAAVQAWSERLPLAVPDASIDTSEAEAIEPPAAVVQAALQPVDERTILLRDALTLVEYLRAPFTGKFPTQPKVGTEWWSGLRAQLDSIEPRLVYALGIPAGEA